MQEQLKSLFSSVKSLPQNYKGDRTIWMIVILLWLLSILIVYSASGFMLINSNVKSSSFLIKQLAFISVGFLVVYFTHKIDYTNYLKFTFPFYVICLILLALTLVLGIEINGAKRWISIPFVNIQFQPSDLAKIGMVLFVSKKLAQNQKKFDTYKDFFMFFIVPILLTAILIVPENLSTGLLVIITGMLLLFIGKAQIKYILYTIGTIFILPAFIIISLATFFYDKELKTSKPLPIFLQVSRVPTWLKRVQGYIYDDKLSQNYQIQQANIAIAKGSVLGVGPGNSEQRYFLPSAYADYIFSILVEEYGLIGGVIIILIYLFFFMRSIKIFVRCNFAFGALVAVGLSMSLVFQALINICVNVGLIPNTGVSLPLISMGGTSYLVSCFAIGIILSVARHVDIQQKEDLIAKNESILI